MIYEERDPQTGDILAKYNFKAENDNHLVIVSFFYSYY